MSTARHLEADVMEDMGTLASNGIAVLSLQTSLSKADSDARLIPKLIRRMARESSWRRFILGHDPDKVHTRNAADFRAFIEDPRPGGCQTDIHILERILRDTDAWPAFLELTRGEPGNPDFQEQPRSDDGSFMGRNCDNVTVTDESPATIPLTENRNPPTGTSTSYALRQLERGVRLRNGDRIPARPDLLALVRTGAMTPNAAAVEAGYRDRSITIPADPVAAARRLRKHFRGADREALIRALQADD